MPWRCTSCSTDVKEDATTACPSCGVKKASWTIQDDKTRTMVVTPRRFDPLASADAATPADLAAYAAVAWAPTETARAMPCATARALVDQRHLPAPADLLVVRVTGGGQRDVHVEVLPDAGQSREVDLPAPPDGPSADVRILPVFGDGAADVAIDGIAVLDVTDGTELGHVCFIDVSAFGRPAKRIRLDGAACATAPAAGKAKLRVRVIKDGDAAAPYECAQVALLEVTQKKPSGAWNTAASGWVEGIELDPGTYSVQVTPGAEWTGASQRVELKAGDAQDVTIPVTKKAAAAAGTGTLLVTLDRGPDVVDPSYQGGVRYPPGTGKVTVVSDPPGRPGQTAYADLVNGKGTVSITLEAGGWLVQSDIPPRVATVTIEAGEQESVTFQAAGAKPGATVDKDVPWSQYFNEQFPLCLNTYMALKIADNFHPGSPPVSWAPSVAPKATGWILDCMRSSVQARVDAEDEQTGRSPPRAGDALKELQAWYPKNKSKFDGLTD